LLAYTNGRFSDLVTEDRPLIMIAGEAERPCGWRAWPAQRVQYKTYVINSGIIETLKIAISPNGPVSQFSRGSTVWYERHGHDREWI